MAKPEKKAILDQYGKKELVRVFLRIIPQLAILLISANNFYWINAWVFGALILTITLAYAIVVVRVNPEVVNERGKGFKEGTKAFDKLFFALWIPLGFLTLIVSGLDAQRYQWTQMTLALVVFGAIINLISGLLSIWAVAVNAHFESTVRIQDDRDHQVCSSGPYRYIRHPGYSGLVVINLSFPLLLGSWWGLVPAAAVVVIMIIRTALEDRMLQKELAGYSDYAAAVRYRLVPGVW